MAEAAEAKVTELQPKRVVFADPARMKLAEYERQDWVLNVPPEVTPEDILKPEFWAHMAQVMRPYDNVEVRQEDGSWIAEIKVLMTDRTWAKVHQLHFYEIPTAVTAQRVEKKFSIEWKGPQKKWCVIRKADSALLKEGLEKGDAVSWLDNYEKTVG